jgi:sortase A
VAPELAAELRPKLGQTMGRITIPSIGVDKYVVHGVRRSDLRQGPGHYPDSPLPGQAGNAAIAGHRTTYGAPFGDLDRLNPGDLIQVETLQGTFTYQVMGHPGEDGSTVGHFIVGPNAVEILDDFGDNRLTLTACHPKYSAAQRIVVTALLVSPPAPVLAPPPSTEPSAPTGDGGDGVDEGDPAPQELPDEDLDAPTSSALDESLGWNRDEVPPTLVWAAGTAAVAAAVVLLGRRWRRWPAWILGTPVVLVPLWFAFGHLDRMLPAL